MQSRTATNSPLLPEVEPTPDVLFGDCEAFDADSLLRKMMPESIKFFDLPLLERLHQRNYHLVRLRGSFRLAKLVRDYRAQLLRSESCQNPRGRTTIERLMFDLGREVYLVYDMPEFLVYAPTTEAAAEAAAKLKQYRKAVEQKPSFKLISINGNHASTQTVTVEQPSPLNEAELHLHYGEDFPRWEAAWIANLRQRHSGVSILHGPPGCGKTSYMRSLTVRLIGSFEFYYVPVSAFDLLSTPNFVNFWLEQKSEGRGKRRLAIIEDAEDLLLPRDEGSRARVSNLLNIADGFLGEHLSLHVVATTNAPIRQLDPALLRPGRLMGTREFRRLNRDEALRLAKAKGLPLPDQQDYSLAEIYCAGASGPVPNAARQIGFAQLRV
jgi:hypothetical protein